MIAALDIPQFRPEYIYICKPIKNKIMSGGLFSRIIYSSESMTMNGIYIAFNLIGQICEIFPSKFKIQFLPNTNGHSTQSSPQIQHTVETIRSLCEMERNILSTMSTPGKTPLYKLHEQLTQNNFKYFEQNETNSSATATNKHKTGSQQNARFILKISGCWNTSSSYGITYKFSRVYPPTP